jgi:hypothetical protein
MKRLIEAYVLTVLAFAGCGSADVGCGPTGLRCGTNELCVEMADIGGPRYRCAPNHCGSATPSCGCAADACAPFSCGRVEGRIVSCFCPNC